VLQRVRRALRRHYVERIFLNRKPWQFEPANVGRYYLVDSRRNIMVHNDVNLEKLAQHLGVLKRWEHLDETNESG
jgi:hypothetical protein